MPYFIVLGGQLVKKNEKNTPVRNDMYPLDEDWFVNNFKLNYKWKEKLLQKKLKQALFKISAQQSKNFTLP